MAYMDRYRKTAVFFIFCAFLVVSALNAASAQDGGSADYPPADRAWSAADYKRLAVLVSSGQKPLPTLADPASKPVFERMVSVKNAALTDIRDKNKPVQQRLVALTQTGGEVRQLLTLYLKEAKKGKPHERELAKLLIYTMQVFGASIGVVDEFAGTIPKDDKYEVRMGGLRQMQGGLRQIYGGVIVSISETHLYSKASTLELIEAALDNLSTYEPILDYQDRQGALAILEGQLETVKDQDTRLALVQLRDSIRKLN